LKRPSSPPPALRTYGSYREGKRKRSPTERSLNKKLPETENKIPQRIPLQPAAAQQKTRSRRETSTKRRLFHHSQRAFWVESEDSGPTGFGLLTLGPTLALGGVYLDYRSIVFFLFVGFRFAVSGVRRPLGIPPRFRSICQAFRTF